MKPVLTLLGLTAACAACCAVPIIGTLLVGLGLGGVGAATIGWGAGLASVLIVGAVAIVLVHRRRSITALACSTTGGDCGCGPKVSMPITSAD